MNKFAIPRPQLKDFSSIDKYMKELRSWKADKARWIKEISSKDHAGKKSMEEIKKEKQYRNRKNLRDRINQLKKRPQKTLDGEILDE